MLNRKVRTGWVKTMKNGTILKGAIIACCLIGMLVLPAAAAPAGLVGNRTGIDPALKTDLWNNQETHRLAIFDENVLNANNVIGIFGKYGIDTTQMQATLSQITGERAALQSAFTNEDRNALKAVNQQLAGLWKQFRQQALTAVRGHYRQASPAAGSTTGSAADLVNAGTGAAAL